VVAAKPVGVLTSEEARDHCEQRAGGSWNKVPVYNRETLVARHQRSHGARDASRTSAGVLVKVLPKLRAAGPVDSVAEVGKVVVMTPIREDQKRLLGKHRLARIALLAACGERMFPIYESYWVGDYAPDVSRTVECGWTCACGGSVRPDDLRLAHGKITGLVDYYNEEDVSILACCTTLALRIVQCIDAATDDDSALAAARGCSEALFVARLADHAIHGAKAPGFPAEAEEREWQEKALLRSEAWQGLANRDMYRDLGALPPLWSPAYQKGRKSPVVFIVGHALLQWCARRMM
jgi:hypothetical protein